jgi:uncharacterized protein (TIGR04222 family)
MTETWGISGPTFLALYSGAALFVLVVAIWHRRRIFRGDNTPGLTLTPAAHAYLSEGPARAVHASLVWLRKHEAVSIGAKGVFQRQGGIPAGASDLDSAVLRACSDGVRASFIAHDTHVKAALSAIAADLTRRGLLLTAEQRKTARRGAWVLFGLLGLGLLRVISSDGRPIGYLLALMLGVTVTAILLLRRPRRTKAGDALIAVAKTQYSHLSPAYKPAWQTYDPAMTALAVGIFGGAVLWEADPLMAAQASSISERQFTSGSSSSSSGCGSGTGCGGGGDGGGGGGGCGGGCGG